ncbi:diguanylate cyclase [Comamonas denitrificans]|uniref:diguanylate cyclase n=1 Tax=Comamonas denitrificans TaxID=117506 RepID=A0A939GZU5_9BURK|nr:diguanylate cyclase [Comamonas denitrificans]MBO1249325.1 diguanylate cyclase [Comamonas denitrificans]
MNLINTEFTLLIVDDEKQNRLLLTELFGTTYKIIQAKNGVQALEKARQHRPDLILLDVLMPEMDGMGVLRELKRDDATRLIPVIFITALDSATDEANGLNLGAVDYISKPFHPPIVRVRVHNQLQLVHQRRLLEQLASLDGLTGIPNRRQFDATLLKEWHRCQRNQQPLSLIVADVDFFKKYNDALGHAAGDRVLQEVAATLRQAARRPGDLVARYGGEEFVLLLPETDATSAQALAEGLQQLLHSKAFAHPNSSLGPWLTMSMGGNTIVPSTTALDPEFFALADAALYRAKHQGRNQVRWAN